MKKRYPNKSNVLLINITRLGDMLQATPTIAGIKEENPGASLTVLVEKQFSSICNHLPYIDEIIPLDLGSTVRSLAKEAEGIVEAYDYVTDVVEDLRSRGFDYCVNMSNSAYTALLIRLLRIQRIGGWAADDEGYRVIESDWARLFASCVFHTNRLYNSLNLVDIFRCSADVEKHPKKLLMNVSDKAMQFARDFIAAQNFTNSGPIIAIQAGASQRKRQWDPRNFSKLINILTKKLNARVILTGSNSEGAIIRRILDMCDTKNAASAAGKTDLEQLAALLKLSDILITGDTGPMHISVAVGTPVVAMFLASALGFETGPYSEGNLVLQPVIDCHPCNPNKACSRPDCHALIVPSELAKLVELRLQGEVNTLPHNMFDSKRVVVYKTVFDEHGFLDMHPLNGEFGGKETARFRKAYRYMWLDDIGGIKVGKPTNGNFKLQIHNDALEGIGQIIDLADKGTQTIETLIETIKDTSSPPSRLKECSALLEQIDHGIEQLGYHVPEAGLLTRMFIFAKENISGSEPLSLASQMSEVYSDLSRRGKKLMDYYHSIN
ncbi:MAG: glycosyltransferase family 9 protein [Candidatus Dadabacteria bacterium]|nr:MAG: glycosyltransferase family 9 protein [Candidatus Dadabacteria bacterium]